MAWLTLLFRQVFTDEALIGLGDYIVYDAILGAIVLALSGGALLEPGHGSARSALLSGAAGLALVGMSVASVVRKSASRRLLATQGALIVLLALGLTLGSIRWALWAPPSTPFRYAPGLTLLLTVYGTLQVAAFGPWTARAARLRLGGMLFGIVFELVLAAFLLLRLSRS